MSFQEFIKRVKKVNNKRDFKITNSIGTKDIYRYIRKNKWFKGESDEKMFYKIIRLTNKELMELVLLGRSIVLPFNMGTIELRLYPVNIKFELGKVKTNLPIDWNKTLKLWYEDEESFNNKTLIKVEKKELFKIYHNKESCRIPNYSFYTLKINRNIIKELNTKSEEGLVQAYLF